LLLGPENLPRHKGHPGFGWNVPRVNPSPCDSQRKNMSTE